ncbi:hypothetical protein PTE30175_03669 [Pandoraea terrae]|uniref:DUF748 domain-containing protein n=1 Tax=Pandoraea terrae TaxID=1537710 RepID=A0A5E4XAJ8_9BURK|nr:DUF748 domain-containing protein [Pandoraea terrae]VVE33245.1 hypothetical protein PTE30175_03669 [Pandoraea terrae]
MADQANDRTPRLQQGLARAQQIGRSPRTRKAALWTAGVLAAFGVIGYFTVPAVLKHYAVEKLSAYLERPVTVGNVTFNPYTLRLDLKQLHIGDKAPGQPFVDIGTLRVDAAWTSLFRLAPVIDELYVDTPVIHIARTAEQRFNFSDIIDKVTAGPPKPQPSEPARFSLSNVQIRNGSVQFDDQVRNEKHAVEKLNVGVPFIANLPSDTDIFVKPLLQASVDGAALDISGQTKPFAKSLESSVDIKLDRLDIPRYLGYVPTELPVVLKKGELTTDLQLKFRREASVNRVVVAGKVSLDDVAVDGRKGEKIATLKHAAANLANLEPLRNIYHVNTVVVDGLDQNLVIAKDGTLALAQLAPQGHPEANAAQSVPGPAAASAPQAASGAMAAKPAAPAGNPLDLLLGDVQLTNSAVHVTDNRAAKPAQVALDDIHVGVKNLATLGKTPATYDVGLKLSGGGTLDAKGAFDLPKRTAGGDIDAKDIALGPLLPFAQGALAGDLKHGTIGAQVKFHTSFGSATPELQIAPATATLDQIEWLTGNKGDAPLKLAHAEAKLSHFDLAKRQVVVDDVQIKGLDVAALRDKDGKINLMALAGNNGAAANVNGRAAPKAAPKRVAAKPSAAKTGNGDWQWQIGRVSLEDASLGLEDRAVKGRPVQARFSPLNVTVKGVSQDMGKPMQLEVKGALNKKGTLTATGSVTPQPLAGDLQIRTEKLDLAAFDSYMSDQLNASIASALLSSDGRATFAQKGATTQATYRGDATLGNVRLLDKVSADDFMRWNSLAVQKINVAVGAGKPNVQIGNVALSTFYARLIISPNGHLNLADVVGNKQEAPKSLTRANPGVPLDTKSASQADAAMSETIGGKPPLDAVASAVEAGQPLPSEAGAPPAKKDAGPGYGAGKALPADVMVGRITLQGGNVNFTDNFVKPNYTANLTSIGGRIGAFGTATTTPADVVLQGKVNRNAPINITGKINPLAPMAFVDLGAKADGIELTNLTPYSTKYAGYPIEKGKLTVDVHYLLDQAKLTANNHIFIDQLTFGDRVESPTATNLPVRLAVSLLKNSRGEIDVNIPISGSLDDPQFSLGGVIFRAFVNLIVKAVTAPFSLLASAFGGSGAEELSYVAFAPGRARLTPEEEKKLDTLVKALKDRPSLKMDIVGRVDPSKDTQGLREAMADRRIKAQKVKSMVGKGESIDIDSVTVEPNERDKFLTAAYKAEDFPKPKNMIGFTKSLPPDEMEKLLVENMKVTDDDLRRLADRRAQNVQSWMDGKIEPDRVFVVSPKLTADGIKDKGATTRVDFALK